MDVIEWLDPVAVRQWYSGAADAPTGVTEDTLALVIAACAEFCQRSRNDLPWSTYTEAVQVPAEVRQAGVMLAGRMLRRRNSMGGVDTFADGSIAYVSRHDPDIDRALRQGAWARPVIA